MAKQSFSDLERHSIVSVHGDRCYLCRAPITLATMQVDHILPESLLEAPDRLKDVLQQYGLPQSFDLGSFSNLLPACGACNNAKRASVFDPVPIFLNSLKKAREKSHLVTGRIERGLQDRELQGALTILRIGIGNGHIKDTDLEALRVLLDPVVLARHDADRRRPVLISEGLALLSTWNGVSLYRGQFGVGGAPEGALVDPSFMCSICGASAWNGARCVNCGQTSDE